MVHNDLERGRRSQLIDRIAFLSDKRFYLYFRLVVPILLIYTIFFVVPVILTVLFSFTNFNGLNLNAFRYVGLRNYRAMFADPALLASAWHTVYFAVGVVLLQNGSAIVVAVALNATLKTKNLLRTLIFMPCMVSPIIVGYLWSYIYARDGILNVLLSVVGIGSLGRSWLGDSRFALTGVIVAHVWIWIGYSAAIYLANLQSIPQEVSESTVLEGVTPLQRFCYITFPLLAPATTVNVSLAFSGSLQVFDIVWSMTGGGPGNATETIGTYMVKQMNNNLFGYAASNSVLLLVFILSATFFIYRNLKSREVDL